MTLVEIIYFILLFHGNIFVSISDCLFTCSFLLLVPFPLSTGVISPLLHSLAPDYTSFAANAVKEGAVWKGAMSPGDVAVNASYALVNLSLLPANQVSSL